MRVELAHFAKPGGTNAEFYVNLTETIAFLIANWLKQTPVLFKTRINT